MEDEEIIALYWDRSENAILETKKKYEALLLTVAGHILHDSEDAKECENDTYLRAWVSIPPNRPENFRAYLSKITRNLAIGRLRKNLAQKRGGDVTVTSFEELAECIPEKAQGKEADGEELRDSLTAFLQALPREKRILFLKRYWYSYSVAEIAKQTGKKEKELTNSLYRLRKKLKAHLESEGNWNQESL